MGDDRVMQYWLMKSEPNSYSIDDLRRDGTTAWDGVRNYQARNIMRDGMHKGDLAFFYHSSTGVIGVVGLMQIVSDSAYPDPTQFDPKDHHYDPKSKRENPAWLLVDVAFREKFPHTVTLDDIKAIPACKHMVLTNRSRLSVQPVREKEVGS